MTKSGTMHRTGAGQSPRSAFAKTGGLSERKQAHPHASGSRFSSRKPLCDPFKGSSASPRSLPVMGALLLRINPCRLDDWLLLNSLAEHIRTGLPGTLVTLWPLRHQGKSRPRALWILADKLRSLCHQNRMFVLSPQPWHI